MSSAWQSHPIVYQINTLVWLNTLSTRFNQPIQLGNVPNEVIEELASYHADCVWLMGIWYRGVFGRNSALNYMHEYRGALPDVTPDDIAGSAYAIGGYKIDRSLGGKRGLETFRKQLAQHGIKLLLDFVPNHVGRDHPWVSEKPDYFMRGTPELLQRDKDNFFAAEDKKGNPLVIALGRDPNFSGWIDTAQLNVFSPNLRSAVIDTLTEIATMCDGVRCDMAMLMTDKVFTRTWGWLGVKPLAQPYWIQVIGAIKAKYPNFMFMAEVYWDMEFQMLQEGFDYTYDKTLYDRALKRDMEGVYGHLRAELAFLKRNIRFIENHDEPRAATTFGIDRSKVFAALISTIPGAVLLHDGQFIGRRIKLPVQIMRQPIEAEHPGLMAFYMNLMDEASADIYQHGEWTLFPRKHAHNGHGHPNILAYAWIHGQDMRLIVLNMSDHRSQAVIDMSSCRTVMEHRALNATDVFSKYSIEWDGDELLNAGLKVDVAPYFVGIYHVKLSKKKQPRLESIFA